MLEATSSSKKILIKNLWEERSHISERDLIIKKIVITIIAVLNFAALGGILYAFITYFPIPAQALLVSPFIVGVLGALTYLKFPTFGISERNYVYYLNPLALVGRICAYVFFGPLLYASTQIDWTPYHDPIIADDISKDLEALYQNYEPEKATIEFWKSASKRWEEKSAVIHAKQKIAALSKQWDGLRKRFKSYLPHPAMPTHDFSKISTEIKVKWRSHCCFGPPLAMLSNVKA